MRSSPKTVLVVDDSPLMRRLIREIVEEDLELQVVGVAENGRVALQKVKELQPDCVLLDVEMPELSGLDTLRRLRLRSPAKVVILSYLGQEGSRTRSEALRLGASDVIDKPTGSVSRDLREARGRLIRETLRRVLGLPPLSALGEPLPSEGAVALASILAVTVRGFGALCERAEAAEAARALNALLSRVEEVTQKHGGILDSDVGSTAVAAFGVPAPQSDDAARAVAAGQEVLESFDTRFATVAEPHGPWRAQAGVVLVTGLVLAGELGPSGSRRYRTAGSAVDQAVRLAGSSGRYGADFIVCERTLGALHPAPPSRRLDVLEIAPDGEPLTLHEILSPREEVDPAALEAYARGWAHYEAGRFAKAVEAFGRALERRPSDRAAALLLTRSRALLRARPAVWRGAWPVDAPGADS
jgi:two-component system chemotaxis response regulator CheB